MEPIGTGDAPTLPLQTSASVPPPHKLSRMAQVSDQQSLATPADNRRDSLPLPLTSSPTSRDGARATRQPHEPRMDSAHAGGDTMSNQFSFTFDAMRSNMDSVQDTSDGNYHDVSNALEARRIQPEPSRR